MSHTEDRKRPFPVFLFLVIGVIVLFVGLRTARENARRDQQPPPEQTAIQLDPTAAQNLSASLGRQRDLSDPSRLRTGDHAEDFGDAESTAAEEIPEGLYPATDDFATSQPIELALLLPRGELVGWVTDGRQLPVSNANVELRYEEAVEGGVEPPQPKVQTDDRGLFHFDEIPAGRWTAVAERANYAAGVVTGIDVPSGERTGPIAISLSPALGLKGTVKAGGQPVDDVRVQAIRDHLALKSDGTAAGMRIVYEDVLTDDKGAFQFTQLPQTRLTLIASHPGYAVLETNIDIQPKTPDAELVLEPEALLGGSVRGPRGNNVGGATLELRAARSEPNSPVVAKTTSADDGSFLFRQLPSGREYDLYAKADKYAPTGPIQTMSGTMTNVVVLDSGGAIEGTITDLNTERTLPGIGIVAIRESESRRLTLWTRTNSDGKYRIERLVPGSYTVAIFNERLTSEPRAGVNVKSTEPTTGIDFTIYPGLRISGVVEDGETGERLQNAKVTLESRVGANLLAGKRSEVSTDASGSFQFENLPQGIYQVTAQLGGYTPGLADESSVRLEVFRDIAPEPVRLRLYRGGIIEGQVVDKGAAAVSGALVQVYHASSTPGRLSGGQLRSLSRRSDSDGQFVIDGIPLNEELHLHISAWTEQLGKASSEMVLLNREQNRRTTEIVLGDGSPLVVTVQDPLERGISESNVSLSHPAFPGDPAPPGWSSKTEQDGSVTFEKIPYGNVRVSASREGYLSAGGSVTVAPDKRASITLELKPARVLTGRVIDDRGQPITAGSVAARAERGATGGGSSGIGSDGSFRITSLGEGTFRLDITAERNTSTGKRRMSWSFPSVEPNDGAGDIILTIPYNGAIVGQVLPPQGDEESVAYNVSIATSYTDSAGRTQRFSTGNTFRNTTEFILDYIPPGEYSLSVSSSNYLPLSVGSIQVESPGETSVGTLWLQPGGKVRLRAVNARTGEPIRGVRANLKPEGPSANTNNDGVAVIAPVKPGVYTLELSHGDYLDASQSLVRASRGQTTDEGDIRMVEGGVAYGTVTDGHQSPLRGILVEARAAETDEVKRASTDGGGRYTIRGLRPGGHILTFSGTINKRRVALSTDIAISSGRNTQQDMVLWANSRMEVVLQGPPGADMGRAVATVYPLRVDLVPLINEAVPVSGIYNGRFVLEDLLEGHYLVTAQAPGPGGQIYWAGTVPVFGATASLTIRSGSGIIRGRILERPQGLSVGGQEVQLELLSAPQSGSRQLRRWWQWSARTDRDGYFMFENLPSGTFSLVANNNTLKADILEIVRLAPGNMTISSDFTFE